MSQPAAVVVDGAERARYKYVLTTGNEARYPEHRDLSYATIFKLGVA